MIVMRRASSSAGSVLSVGPVVDPFEVAPRAGGVVGVYVHLPNAQLSMYRAGPAEGSMSPFRDESAFVSEDLGGVLL